MADLAAKHGARTVALEHRFYGESLPSADDLATALSVDNLQFHSVEQSLADLAAFIMYFDAEATWFAFGGSYPGALSAWFRIAYPNSTVGSHSSSGVVNAIYEFEEFDEQVAASAGADCADAIRATTAALEDAVVLSTESAAHVKGLFGAGALEGADFWYMTADSAAMAVQYGMKADLCTPLTEAAKHGGDLISTFANLTNQIWGDSFGSDCFYDTNCLKDPAQAARWQPTARSWRWQKCSQLAYFQVAPATGSLRSTDVTLDYHEWQCAQAFGEGTTNAKQATAAINAKLGGDEPQGESIYFANGSDDPWQQASLSPLDSTSPREPAMLAVCDSCGHCGDLHSASDADPPNLTAQRDAIAGFVSQWLDAAAVTEKQASH